MLLMVFDETAQVAGVYTRSLTAAAPVHWCRTACSDGHIRALLVNAGNANAFTGSQGKSDNEALASAVAEETGGQASQMMISSTGVIGEFLPTEPMLDAIPDLYTNLSDTHWEQAARAIMTTDTFPKMVSKTAMIGATEVTINGIAKGSGMIAPDMATMLGYIVTDATLPASVLQPLLSRMTVKTFNSITVDSDTSTNDTVLLIATGAQDNIIPDSAGDKLLDNFKRALLDVMRELAILIVKDGEGASKFVTLHINGAEDNESARQIGLSIANSPLVKTMLAASDPNWGRIVAAVGKSGRWVDTDRLKITIGDTVVTDGGNVRPDYNEDRTALYMKQPELTISVDVGVGEGEATVWTCDFTEGYIRINADYRS